MRYVGIAALAATFWLSVVTLRLMIHGVPCAVSASARPGAPMPVVVEKRGLNKREGHICSLPHPRERTRPPEPEGNPLQKSVLVAGLNAVRPLIAACYRWYQVPGTAMVNIVIAKNGRVSSAAVTGKFAGTPTGACVEAAVKTVRFPASDGFATPYPFQLK